MTPIPAQSPAPDPAAAKLIEWHRARDNGDAELASKLWSEYLREVEREMEGKAA